VVMVMVRSDDVVYLSSPSCVGGGATRVIHFSSKPSLSSSTRMLASPIASDLPVSHS
jgi:hypothetical protein